MSDPLSWPKPPRSGTRTARKGLYILPSVFTAANIAAGYYAISQAIQGTAVDPWHFDQAAKAIGFAILFDGLDGRIARMTNTASAFGRELDSLADVIAFGIAPAILAWLWGFRMLPAMDDFELRNKVVQFGAIATFIFLMAGAARLGASISRSIRSRRTPGGRVRSISSACRSPLEPVSLFRLCILPPETPFKSGGSRSAGAFLFWPSRF